MRTTIIIASIVALLAPGALAGTPDDPEIIDAALDAGAGNAWADIEKAWIEQLDAHTLRMHVQLTALPETRLGNVFGILFDANGTSYFAGLVHVETRSFEMGHFDRAAMEPTQMEEIKGELVTGAPARISFDVPVSRVGQDVSRLTSLAAFSVEITAGVAGGPFVVLDEAAASRDFELAAREAEAPEPTATPAAEPAQEGPADPDDAVAPAADAPRETPLPLWGALAAVAVAIALRRR